jgi:hypothetical protein
VLARAGARSARVAESDGAAGQAVTGPRDFGPLGISTHIGAGARRDRFSTIDNRGRRCLREPAHGLREWPRAMARRGRLLPDLGISAPSGFPRILMGPIYDHRQTEVRPVAAHRPRACRRAMAHRRRRFADLARFGKLALQHAPVACTHEQLSSLHLNEDAVGPRFFFSQDCFHGQWGGLPVNVEHVSHAVCIHAPDRARPPRATNLDPWH